MVYVVATGWAMFNLSFDIWSAFIVGPFVLGVGVVALRRVFAATSVTCSRSPSPAWWPRSRRDRVAYWVAFDAYGGASDAVRYHEVGSLLAARGARGRASPTGARPAVDRDDVHRPPHRRHGYTVVGSGRLSGSCCFLSSPSGGSCCSWKPRLSACPASLADGMPRCACSARPCCSGRARSARRHSCACASVLRRGVGRTL